MFSTIFNKLFLHLLKQCKFIIRVMIFTVEKYVCYNLLKSITAARNGNYIVATLNVTASGEIRAESDIYR